MRRRLFGMVVISMSVCPLVFAETPSPTQGEKEREPEAVTQEGARDTEDATRAQESQPPVPPGLEKQGRLPQGLDKQGKTPRGWSQGKAWWKHPSQARPASAKPGPFSAKARGGESPSGHSSAAHSHSGRGHR